MRLLFKLLIDEQLRLGGNMCNNVQVYEYGPHQQTFHVSVDRALQNFGRFSLLNNGFCIFQLSDSIGEIMSNL